MWKVDIFDVVARTDRTPRRANESFFAFLNRTGSEFYRPVRDLLQSWLNHVPSADQSGVAAALRSDDNEIFESAFWELYLHQVITGSGIEVTIHPALPGTSRHPDFLVHTEQPYLLEAVSVGTSRQARTERRRLNEVEAVLDAVRVDGWTLAFTWHEIGPVPLPSARVRSLLLRWLDELDRMSSPSVGDPDAEDRLPTLHVADAGWELEFNAIPVGPGSGPLVGVRGAGTGSVVDNRTGLRRMLASKAKRYGTDLSFPLVTAVLSNTEFPTRTYDVVPVLYGMHWLGPARVTDLQELATDGHWRTRQGWRRSHNPYAIIAAGLHLFNLSTVKPWAFRTLAPGVEANLELPYAEPLDLQVPEPAAPTVPPDHAALGIAADWCRGKPDLDDVQ